MTYHAFTEADAIAYAKRQGLFAESAKIDSREIGDGNLNLVFHLTDRDSGKSVIFKQALPYAKVVGESWPLTLDRARIESEALIIQGKLCPGLVPEVYACETELALTVMEDLSDHVIMRRGLIERNRYPRFADDISTFLARTLFYTSDLGMNQQEKKLQQGRFINPELCKITEDLIFDDPYTDSPNNNMDEHLREEVAVLWRDEQLHLEVAMLRDGFLTRSQALLHGDLHTGSIFIKPDSTKVIDPEFAYYGPMGFDIGAVIANLLLNYAGQEQWSPTAEKRADYRAYLLETIRQVWSSFDSKFRALWDEHGVDRLSRTPGYQDYYMKRLLQDTIGYAGCKMIRRVHGLAHVADIDRIESADVRKRAQLMALAMGTALVKGNRTAESIDDVLEAARKGEQQ